MITDALFMPNNKLFILTNLLERPIHISLEMPVCFRLLSPFCTHNLIVCKQRIAVRFFLSFSDNRPIVWLLPCIYSRSNRRLIKQMQTILKWEYKISSATDETLPF